MPLHYTLPPLGANETHSLEVSEVRGLELEGRLVGGSIQGRCVKVRGNQRKRFPVACKKKLKKKKINNK